MWNCQRPYSTLLEEPPPVEDCMGCPHLTSRLANDGRVPLKLKRTLPIAQAS